MLTSASKEREFTWAAVSRTVMEKATSIFGGKTPK
jgi:hypothetical protein